MINVSDSVVIAKPLSEVFSFVVDQNNVIKWQKAVISVEVPACPLGVGSQFVIVRRFMGQEMKMFYEVVELQQDAGFILKSSGGPVKVLVTVSFEPAGGDTKMTTELHAEVGGFFKVAEGLVAKQMTSQLVNDDATVKSMLEKV
jgi:uncharacterized membrane protein